MIRWPLERAIGAHILMQSGHLVRFTCAKITISVDETNTVEGYSWNNARGAPLFIDHTRIESVILTRVLRLRKDTPPDAETEGRG